MQEVIEADTEEGRQAGWRGGAASCLPRVAAWHLSSSATSSLVCLPRVLLPLPLTHPLPHLPFLSFPSACSSRSLKVPFSCILTALTFLLPLPQFPYKSLLRHNLTPILLLLPVSPLLPTLGFVCSSFFFFFSYSTLLFFSFLSILFHPYSCIHFPTKFLSVPLSFFLPPTSRPTLSSCPHFPSLPPTVCHSSSRPSVSLHPCLSVNERSKRGQTEVRGKSKGVLRKEKI